MRIRGRKVVRTTAVAAVLCLLVASCGGDDDSSEPDDAAGAEVDHDPNGILRAALDLTQQYHFDPTLSQAAGLDLPRQALIYDQLLRPLPDGSYGPGLATKATVVDPQLIELELRKDVAFSDGTPFDAAAVKFGIERNRDTKKPQFFPELQEVSAVEVVDSLTARIQLKTPVAGAFYPSLAGLDTIIVSPTAVRNGVDLDKNPVGAGPFVLNEFTREARLVLRKNEKYWDAKNLKLAGIDYVHVAAGPQIINALGSHQVDAAAIAFDQIDAATGTGFQVDTFTPVTSMIHAPICKATKPFDDVRVRQALNYALDRDAINETLFAGKGKPAWSLVPEGHQFFPKSLDEYYDVDVAKAKKLLADAGFPNGISFELMLPTDPQSLAIGQVVQAQWEKAGIKVQLRQTPSFVQEFYTDRKAPLLFVGSVQPGIRHFAQWSGATLANTCGYSDPKLNALIDQLRALSPEDTKGVEVWAEAQEYVVKNALSAWTLFVPTAAAFDADRVGGIEFISFPIAGAPAVNYLSAYVKK